MSKRSCYNCKHLWRQTESWEMSWIWWYSCCERPSMENLSSFPFHQTKCRDFTEREVATANLISQER